MNLYQAGRALCSQKSNNNAPFQVKPTIMGAAWNCLLNELGCCGFDSNRRPTWLAAL